MRGLPTHVVDGLVASAMTRLSPTGYGCIVAVLFAVLIGCPEMDDDAEPGDDDTGQADDDVGDDDTGDDDTGDDDTGDDDTGDDDDSGDDDTLAPQPGHCWSLVSTGYQVAVLDIDLTEQTWAEYGRYGWWIDSVGWSMGIGLYGGRIYASIYRAVQDEGFYWFELDPAAGMVGWGPMAYWGGVAANSTHLVTFHDANTVVLYPSFADVVAESNQVFVSGDFAAWVLATSDSRLYIAEPDRIWVHNLTDGALIESVALEDWDQPVGGVSVLDGVVTLITDSGRIGETRLARFDIHTGSKLAEISFPEFGQLYPQHPSGLWCE